MQRKLQLAPTPRGALTVLHQDQGTLVTTQKGPRYLLRMAQQQKLVQNPLLLVVVSLAEELQSRHRPASGPLARRSELEAWAKSRLQGI